MIEAYPTSHVDTSHDVIPGVAGEGSKGNISAEQKLFVGVMQQALDDYRKYHREKLGEGRIIREEIECWLASSSDDPLSFNWYCAMLNLEPEYVLRMFDRAAGKTPRTAAAA